MSNINLLPEELNKSKGTGALLFILKKVSLMSGIVVILAIILASGVLFFFSRQLADVQSKNSELTANIKKLSQTEQKLFLVKDRISKIDKVLADKMQSENSIGNIDQTVSSMSSSLSFKTAKIEANALDLTLAAKDSFSIGEFLQVLVQPNTNYAKVVLKNLGFNSDLGYTIDLKMF